MTITAQQAADIRERLARFEAWRNGRSGYRVEDIPADVPRVSNEEISALEVFEFIHDAPEKYFLYIREKEREAITWTGDKLGDITYMGPIWGDNFGGKRRSITVRAINGKCYVGTYYTSSGNYARVKLVPELATWRTVANGDVPCQVLERRPLSNGGARVRIKVTADRGAYKRGEVIETSSSWVRAR